MKSFRTMACCGKQALVIAVLLILCGIAKTGRAQETLRSDPVITDSLQAKNLPSPRGAMIRSLIFPGWGQWYVGKKFKAGLVFLTETGIVGTGIYWNQKLQAATMKLDQEFYRNNRNLAFWYLGGAMLLSMADAYVDAHLAGFDVSPDLSLKTREMKFGLCLRF